MINVSQNPAHLHDAIFRQSFIYNSFDHPYDCLKDFFNDKDLKEHLKTLKRWKKLVQTGDFFEISVFSNPIYDHKLMCNLINAAYMFNEAPYLVAVTNGNLSDAAQDAFLVAECMEHDVYPKHLANVELIDPFIGIKNVFETIDLASLHQQLYEWLNVCFSPNVTMMDTNLVGITYRSVRKLIECCWLIFVRGEAIDVGTKADETRFEEHQELTVNDYMKMDIIVATPGDAGDLWAVNDQGKIVVSTNNDDDIPAHLREAFKQFLDVVPANRLNRNLRKMLTDYLFYNMDGLPLDFEELLLDFYWLTDLLDEIQGKDIEIKFH